MKVHHLNCGSFCPHIKVLSDISHCHCLLIESNDGLILIDTGIGKNTTTAGIDTMKKIAGVDSQKFLSAKEQIEGLGFKTSDVRHILVTHLDYDHAGGVPDFDQATLHVCKTEMNEANKSFHQFRYQKQLWKSHTNILTYNEFGERWNGFEAVKNLPGLPPEILMVPLHGHTKGHCGFAIKQDKNWLFHVGDAYFNRLELEGGMKALPYNLFARLNAYDNGERKHNLQRIKELEEKADSSLKVMNSHDPKDFKKFK